MYDDLEMKKMFNSVEGTTLMDMDLPATKFVIKDLLPQGLAIIGGSPKVGKSWLMLDWCVRIAKGETIWNFPTTKGTTLYVSLEDTASRLQERLLSVTDEAPNVFFTTFSFKIGEGLEEQIKSFVADHPGTALIVIDTFQMIRNTGSEVSYANDYNEVEILKKFAEELKITILLVHHLRKQGDSDPFNMLSGTNGLAGGVDTMFVLDKSKRCSTNATLYCSGRDIEDRKIELSFDKDNCTWNFVSDNSDNPEMLLLRSKISVPSRFRRKNNSASRIPMRRLSTKKLGISFKRCARAEFAKPVWVKSINTVDSSIVPTAAKSIILSGEKQ